MPPFISPIVWGSNRSWVTGLPPRSTEQKAAKTFEQKAAKVTKGLGSTTYVDVLQAITEHSLRTRLW
jgi:hypothetical protein